MRPIFSTYPIFAAKSDDGQFQANVMTSIVATPAVLSYIYVASAHFAATGGLFDDAGRNDRKFMT